MAMTHEVTLMVASTGHTVDVFDEYTITLDMLRPGEAWTFSLWRSGVDYFGNPSTLNDSIPPEARRTGWEIIRRIQLGGRIDVAIDGHVQLSGEIESADIVDNGKDGQVIVLSGRDVAGRAMEADADPALTLRGLPLSEALSRLFQPLGLLVEISDAVAAREAQAGRRGRRGITTATRTNRVDLVHPRPGEKVWQVAESIVRRLGYLIWVAPSPRGGLAIVVDVPDYTTAPAYRFERRFNGNVMTAGSNILKCTQRRSIRGVPTAVYGLGRAARGDSTPARVRSSVENTELTRRSDVHQPPPILPRYLHSRRGRSPAGAQREAQRLMSEAQLNSRLLEVTVQGHGQDVSENERRLYAVNSTAYLYDRLNEADDIYHIHRLTFARSRANGTTTQLVLGEREAISVEPQT